MPTLKQVKRIIIIGLQIILLIISFGGSLALTYGSILNAIELYDAGFKFWEWGWLEWARVVGLFFLVIGGPLGLFF